jgi:4-hydroxybenzoate polyprenyltransferase
MPSLAVGALTAGLAALAGLPLDRAVLVTAAVFTGQLSIGWSNDYLDAERDQAVARSDKPVVAGELTPRAAAIAAVVALLVTFALSAALGWPGGAAVVGTAACGWAYNLGLKANALSWLPYAVGFGLLPAVVTLSDTPPRWPAAWALTAAALLGVAGHLANALPDLRGDDATGVWGLPHWLGAKATALAGAGILLVASAVILFGANGQSVWWRAAGFVAALLVTGTAAASALRDPTSERFFRATILIAAMDLVFFALSGTSL